ncbi:hypothetical protein MHYP_G00064160 [Metynnis hypsauchen]
MLSSSQIVLLAGFWIAAAAIRIEEVDSATHAEEYRCIVDGDAAATTYTWRSCFRTVDSDRLFIADL